jgi:hypothetical protein
VGYQERKRLRLSQEYGPVSGADGWGGGKGGLVTVREGSWTRSGKSALLILAR